jgi:hypothetical protein
MFIYLILSVFMSRPIYLLACQGICALFFIVFICLPKKLSNIISINKYPSQVVQFESSLMA